MLTLVTRLVFLCALALARCGGGGGEVLPRTAPVGPDPAAGTYLEVAVPFGERFRWTPSAGSTVVDLPVEIHDGPGQVPDAMLADGFTPDEIERQLHLAVEAWAVVLRQEGLPAPVLEVRRRSRGEDFAGDPRTRLHLRLRQNPDDLFSATTTMLRIGARLDQVRELEITLRTPTLGARPSLDGYQSLLLHEVGHALGILADAPAGGHSLAEADVMFPVAQWTALSPADRAAIRALYAAPPDLVREDRTPAADPGPGSGLPWPTMPRWASSAPSSAAVSASCSVAR